MQATGCRASRTSANLQHSINSRLSALCDDIHKQTRQRGLAGAGLWPSAGQRAWLPARAPTPHPSGEPRLMANRSAPAYLCCWVKDSRNEQNGGTCGNLRASHGDCCPSAGRMARVEDLLLLWDHPWSDTLGRSADIGVLLSLQCQRSRATWATLLNPDHSMLHQLSNSLFRRQREFPSCSACLSLLVMI